MGRIGRPETGETRHFKGGGASLPPVIWTFMIANGRWGLQRRSPDWRVFLKGMADWPKEEVGERLTSSREVAVFGFGLTRGGPGPKGVAELSERDRRASDRLDMNLAPGTLWYMGTRIRCTVIDLSLTGCCLKVQEDFKAGALAHVKVTVPIDGMVLSIWGITQWVRRERMLGIHFIHPTGRSKNQLAGLLTCLLDRSASEVVKAALAAQAESLIISLEQTESVSGGPATVLAQALEVAVQRGVPAPLRPRLRDTHKVQDLSAEESPAVLHLVTGDLQLGGHILDLSSSGCIVRVNHPYAGNIMVRIEVDFEIRGLHFRLPGVTEAFHDKHTVEVRFLDVSPRKKEDLDQVIREMIEIDGKKNSGCEALSETRT